MKDFEWRARCLGIHSDPAVAALIHQIHDQTTYLENLWEQQRDPGYKKQWWQDGEYDAVRADAANDQGLDHFSHKNYGDAFHCFSEAIRLHPSSPVYHSNRAALAMKLNRPDIAAADAEHAIERDPAYLKAIIRAGHARLKLTEYESAIDHFQRALDIDSTCDTARQWLAQARQEREREKAKTNSMRQNIRPALKRVCESEEHPHHHHEDVLEEATMQLLAADTVLSSPTCPRPVRDAALCSKIEAMIICARYSDALALCDALSDANTIEQVYLRAEALWRGGDVYGAVQLLQNIQGGDKGNGVQKCADLQSYLCTDIVPALDSIEQSREDEIFLDVIDHCSALLGNIRPCICFGLYTKLLKYRSNAYATRRQWEQAREDVERVLRWHEGDGSALLLRANLHKQTGKYLEYFLDLQRLKKVDPGASGLAETVEDAARLCVMYGARIEGDDASSSAPYSRNSRVYGPESEFSILGLSASSTASFADVRRAYLKAATAWHPDKWATASEKERKIAEERFKKIQTAYERLTATGA